MSLVAVRKSICGPPRSSPLNRQRPVSSRTSRAAHSSGDSPNSKWPPGRAKVPAPCEFRRFPMRNRGLSASSWTDWRTKTPTPTLTMGTSGIMLNKYTRTRCRCEMEERDVEMRGTNPSRLRCEPVRGPRFVLLIKFNQSSLTGTAVLCTLKATNLHYFLLHKRYKRILS